MSCFSDSNKAFKRVAASSSHFLCLVSVPHSLKALLHLRLKIFYILISAKQKIVVTLQLNRWHCYNKPFLSKAYNFETTSSYSVTIWILWTFKFLKYSDSHENYYSKQFKDASFRSGVIVPFFFSKNGGFRPNMVRIRRIHWCVLICIKKCIKIRYFKIWSKSQPWKNKFVNLLTSEAIIGEFL